MGPEMGTHFFPVPWPTLPGHRGMELAQVPAKDLAAGDNPHQHGRDELTASPRSYERGRG